LRVRYAQVEESGRLESYGGCRASRVRYGASRSGYIFYWKVMKGVVNREFVYLMVMVLKIK
jgi:hypothetical protein